ncbi:hypothetical protein QE152_g40305 [Popillia japonica]|uniref:Uncharacterized protein n=1 Tax=Popillia japonica TaxID=7064 RepID=A0AAW1HRZ3_POPJA
MQRGAHNGPTGEQTGKREDENLSVLNRIRRLFVQKFDGEVVQPPDAVGISNLNPRLAALVGAFTSSPHPLHSGLVAPWRTDAGDVSTNTVQDEIHLFRNGQQRDRDGSIRRIGKPRCYVLRNLCCV